MTTADKRTTPNRESAATADAAPNGATRRAGTRGTTAGETYRDTGAGEMPGPVVAAHEPDAHEPDAGVAEDGGLTLPTIRDVWRAQEVIRPHVAHTPILPSRTLSAMTGATVALKAENLQRSGAYKIRGATYKLSRLGPEERARGVIAASAGNHAQGVAIAAASLGIPCTIVMPEAAPLAKVTATQGYGARVVLAGETYNEAYARARELQAETGATYIHAYDDPDIIAGQGTVALEILADQPDVEAIVVGIGGGGLISGIATAVKALKPDVRIIGVEAAGAASMRAALDAGQVVALPAINTIADGIATKTVGRYTFEIVRTLVDDVIAVDDEEIIRAVLLLLERCKLLVEGAGAVGVAALLGGRLDLAGKRTVAVLRGGNIDMNMVGKFNKHGLSVQGRYLVVHTLLPDRPGELLRLLALIAEQRVNVLDIEHHRAGPRLPIQQVEVVMTLETRDRVHCAALLELLRARGYAVREAEPAFALGSESRLGG
jgi:threonine dehydratase